MGVGWNETHGLAAKKKPMIQVSNTSIGEHAGLA